MSNQDKKPESKRSEAVRRAQDKYNQKRVSYKVWLNGETEADLIQTIRSMDNFSGWVKDKIREYQNESKS